MSHLSLPIERRTSPSATASKSAHETAAQRSNALIELFPGWIEEGLEAAGLTEEEAARWLGMPRSQWSRQKRYVDGYAFGIQRNAQLPDAFWRVIARRLGEFYGTDEPQARRIRLRRAVHVLVDLLDDVNREAA